MSRGDALYQSYKNYPVTLFFHKLIKFQFLQYLRKVTGGKSLKKYFFEFSKKYLKILFEVIKKGHC